ncbi:MAG: hypothetical protein COB24_11025 [Hyphomicrobiales bacterium]|nr:MAG: hypothetical protein COB24_11025 [Hyphomicrobiales bacterium]
MRLNLQQMLSFRMRFVSTIPIHFSERDSGHSKPLPTNARSASKPNLFGITHASANRERKRTYKCRLPELRQDAAQ